MTSQIFLIVLLAFVAWMLWHQLRRTSATEARRLHQMGARVVDVRTPGEFASGHFEGAVNIPLGEVGTRVPAELPDRTQPILLYCASGTRSGMAMNQLRTLGYLNAHNLGSLGRARSILG